MTHVAEQQKAEESKSQKQGFPTEAEGLEQIHHLTLDASKHIEAIETRAAGCYWFFARITPDAGKGTNWLTINGLPAGTRAISVWMTEFVLPNNPHAGGAVFYTHSVQLYENGTKCRVRFYLDWSDALPAAAQVIYCL